MSLRNKAGRVGRGWRPREAHTICHALRVLDLIKGNGRTSLVVWIPYDSISLNTGGLNWTKFSRLDPYLS